MQTAHSSQHIPHMTNFHMLITPVSSCAGKDLEEFVCRAAKNASHTSSDAITDFMEAIGVLVDELQVNRLLDAPFFRLMADECSTDIATREVLSLFFDTRWKTELLSIHEKSPFEERQC